MRRIAFIAVALGLAGTAFAAEIGNLAWNQSNIQTLRSLGKAEIFQLITGGNADRTFTERNVWEFGWYDLAGDGNYELAYTGSSGPCCVWLTIVSRDTAVVNGQSFKQAAKLANTIRDLNGDGRDELIIWKLAVDNGGGAEYYWPAVYKLESGKYVEASRDFPGFYDNEVLPKLSRDIAKAQAAAKLETGPDKPQVERAAGLIMERDKILRVLGRRPAAGIRQA